MKPLSKDRNSETWGDKEKVNPLLSSELGKFGGQEVNSELGTHACEIQC